MIQKRIIDTTSLGSRCFKGTDKSILEKDSSVPLMHGDPSDFGSVILSSFRISPKERTLGTNLGEPGAVIRDGTRTGIKFSSKAKRAPRNISLPFLNKKHLSTLSHSLTLCQSSRAERFLTNFQSFEASNRGQSSSRCTLDQWVDLIGVITS